MSDSRTASAGAAVIFLFIQISLAKFEGYGAAEPQSSVFSHQKSDNDDNDGAKLHESVFTPRSDLMYFTFL